MTPIHEFTHLVETADEELRIVHCTFAIDKEHKAKFALIGDKVLEINNCIILKTDDDIIPL